MRSHSGILYVNKQFCRKLFSYSFWHSPCSYLCKYCKIVMIESSSMHHSCHDDDCIIWVIFLFFAPQDIYLQRNNISLYVLSSAYYADVTSDAILFSELFVCCWRRTKLLFSFQYCYYFPSNFYMMQNSANMWKLENLFIIWTDR